MCAKTKVHFTRDQRDILEKEYTNNQHPQHDTYHLLGNTFGFESDKIEHWFGNRRKMASKGIEPKSRRNRKEKKIKSTRDCRS
jgi:hypothetical protein